MEGGIAYVRSPSYAEIALPRVAITGPDSNQTSTGGRATVQGAAEATKTMHQPPAPRPLRWMQRPRGSPGAPRPLWLPRGARISRQAAPSEQPTGSLAATGLPRRDKGSAGCIGLLPPGHDRGRRQDEGVNPVFCRPDKTIGLLPAGRQAGVEPRHHVVAQLALVVRTGHHPIAARLDVGRSILDSPLDLVLLRAAQ